jgi:hypothetical protein
MQDEDKDEEREDERRMGRRSSSGVASVAGKRDE